MNGYALLGSLSGAAFAYFFINYLFSRSAYRRATFIERANALISESKRLESRRSLRTSLKTWLVQHGWAGNFLPVVASAGMLYLLLILMLIGFGAGSTLAAVVAIPASIVTATMLVKVVEDRRRLAFRRQLLQAMNLIAASIESGLGAERAIAGIVGQIDNPLGEELEQVLNETRAGKDLVVSLREMGERYPSRALVMLVSALEIDRKVGGSLGPVLRQAAATLEREFDISSEAQAEIAQTRSEFFIVTGIILGICVTMITGSGSSGAAAYGSTVGEIAMGLVGANFIWGIVRVLRVLRQAKGQS